MSFYQKYNEAKQIPFESFFSSIMEEDILRVIHKSALKESDFLTLLSPAAQPFLEAMALKAQQATIQHFGKTIQLYAPLYISDYCVNQCEYCSFSIDNEFARRRLSFAELETEAQLLAKTGIRHILVLTGESRVHASMDYLKQSIAILQKYFSSISLEIHPLDTAEYRELVQAGISGLTIYQETYNEDIYDRIHIKGPKRNYLYRIDTPERGCEAGMHKVNIGALLGLDDWRKEVFFTGLHAHYLQQKYPDTEISVSFPRIRPNLGGFQPSSEVLDQHLVQAVLAIRLFLPQAGISLSTREQPDFRDSLVRLGVTKMSAASSTAVGGYANKTNSISQF